MNLFGNYLKEFLEKKGYKLEYAADEIGVSFGLLGHYINGRRSPSYKFLEKFFKAFNINQLEQKRIMELVEIDKMPEELKKIRVNKEKQQSVPNGKSLTEDDFIEMPVKAKASAGNGYINFEDTLYTRLIRRGNFCQDCYLIEVAGNSMEPLIQDGSLVIVDPHQTEYIANKIYVVKVGEETFVKRVLIKEEAQVMILKSINTDYDDVYIAGKELENVKLLGRAIKFVYEGNL